MKNTILICLGLASSAFATVTINFTGGLGATVGLTDSNGISAGLQWGIVASTDNFAASACNYGPVGTTLDSGISSGWIQVSSNDYVWLADSAATVGAPNSYTGDFGPGLEGGIVSLTNIDVSGAVGTGDSYGLIWFDSGTGLSAGDTYTTFMSGGSDGTTAGFPTADTEIQADGTTVQAFFDDIRTNADGTTKTVTVIPEPTSGALLGLAGLALVARRKR